MGSWKKQLDHSWYTGLPLSAGIVVTQPCFPAEDKICRILKASQLLKLPLCEAFIVDESKNDVQLLKLIIGERLDQRWKGIGASFCAKIFQNLDISYPCFAPAHLTFLGCKQLQVKTRTLMRLKVSPAAAECCWSIAKSCRDGSGGFAAGWRKNWNWKGGVEIISIHCYLFNLHCSLFLPPPTYSLFAAFHISKERHKHKNEEVHII